MKIAQTTFVLTFRRSRRSHVARASGVGTATRGSLIRTARSEFEANPDRRRHFQTARGAIPSAAAIAGSSRPCSYSSRRFLSSCWSRGLFRPTLGGRPCRVRHWTTEHLLTPLLFAIAISVMPLASIARRASCISGRAPVTFHLLGSRQARLEDAMGNTHRGSVEIRDSRETLRAENRQSARHQPGLQVQRSGLATSRPPSRAGRSVLRDFVRHPRPVLSSQDPDRVCARGLNRVCTSLRTGVASRAVPKAVEDR